MRQRASQPLLSSYGVRLEVLPCRLLVGQTRLLETTNDRSATHRNPELLRDDLVNPLGCPEIGLEAERGGGFQNHSPPLLRGHLLKFAGATTAVKACQSLRTAHLAVSSEPAVEGRTVDLVGLGDMGDWHAPLHGLDRPDPDFVGWVLCFLHPSVVSQHRLLGKLV